MASILEVILNTRKILFFLLSEWNVAMVKFFCSWGVCVLNNPLNTVHIFLVHY